MYGVYETDAGNRVEAHRQPKCPSCGKYHGDDVILRRIGYHDTHGIYNTLRHPEDHWAVLRRCEWDRMVASGYFKLINPMAQRRCDCGAFCDEGFCQCDPGCEACIYDHA